MINMIVSDNGEKKKVRLESAHIHATKELAEFYSFSFLIYSLIYGSLHDNTMDQIVKIDTHKLKITMPATARPSCYT